MCSEERDAGTNRDSDQLKRARLAAYLHDEVSGPLSLAARESQRQIRLAEMGGEQTASTDQRAAWKAVNADVTRALRNLHRVVARLLDADRDHNALTPRQLSAEVFVRTLRQTVEQEQRRLSGLGFIGKATVTGELERVPDAATRDEILALVHELCANVDKHCTSASSVYELSVHCSADRIEISELCRWTAPRPTITAPEVGGQGLSAHRLIIRHIGGELVWHSGQWQWNCYARIPILTETEDSALRDAETKRYR
ncbi:hypothetical protein [Bifidobacterium avesanii]|uniref:Histidine kinase n=1 Tax=Bifidobacterium avesanii TaxID=1798157 RepID=A0A7K3TH08_9BIFI|nr:hypothetical protein [Bifidobacterium avesanii]KAB8290620.1 hypothetical protein DSM100685_1413 [Bifidobacterium avesanii]NEG77989.1 hypothetical protein [Bifidobacterium avesanii]